jgi:hypothetical protein
MRDFYATVAQVLPIVVLALVWDSGYFETLRDPNRTAWFWKTPVVRTYSVIVATVVIADTALCLMVLAGVLGNSVALRGTVFAGIALALGSLLFRICAHILGSDVVRQPKGNRASSSGNPELDWLKLEQYRLKLKQERLEQNIKVEQERLQFEQDRLI